MLSVLGLAKGRLCIEVCRCFIREQRQQGDEKGKEGGSWVK